MELRQQPEDRIQIGAEVLAEFIDDGAIYRARVQKVDHENRNCLVEFYDFGNTGKSSFSKIYFYDEPKFDFLRPLAYAINIDGFDWTEFGEGEFLIFGFAKI